MKIIPAIDIRNGACVRLYQGRFDRQTRYASDAAKVAETFSGMGFSDLHLVDLDGALSGDQTQQQTVQKIVDSTDFEIQLGGGIRSEAAVRACLESGISRCVLGSVAVTDQNLVQTLLKMFGPENIVLALDIRQDTTDQPLLATQGWTQATQTTLWQCVDAYDKFAVQHVLCTDISRDGAMTGPNLELYAEFVRRYPRISLQASGGVRNIDDLHRLRESGVAAAITGKALLEGQISSAEIAAFQPAA